MIKLTPSILRILIHCFLNPYIHSAFFRSSSPWNVEWNHLVVNLPYRSSPLSRGKLEISFNVPPNQWLVTEIEVRKTRLAHLVQTWIWSCHRNEYLFHTFCACLCKTAVKLLRLMKSPTKPTIHSALFYKDKALKIVRRNPRWPSLNEISITYSSFSCVFSQ